MHFEPASEIPRLRAGLRDLVALSSIPATWVGRAPRDVADGLADALIGLLGLDFAFVRFCEPEGDGAVEVTRGTPWAAFPQWLERHIARNHRLPHGDLVPEVAGEELRARGLVMPIGVGAEYGVVAATCDRPDFPTEIDRLLLSLAANLAATSLQSARLIQERRRAEGALRDARDELELIVAQRTEELRQSEASLAASRARIVDAADDERRRVVRDLHDGAQSRLVHAVITLKLAGARDDLAPAARPLLEEALAHASAAIDELRELAHGIHPAGLTTSGLNGAIGELAERAPLQVDVDVPDERYPGAVESAAYFLVAEALTNVAKHARAHRASVTVGISDGIVAVEVRDDGVGGAAPDGPGLVGMQDRLAALGGRLRVLSPPEGGTTIAAEIPLGRD